MSWKLRLFFYASAMLATVLGASCKKSQPALREITLGLSWLHQAQFSGPYYADQHGLYEKEGLRVEFIAATIEQDPLERFLAGDYDVVIAQPDALIRARADGHGVTAVAATFRVHPQEFLALASSGIKTPVDFRGKKVGVSYSEKLILQAMLSKAGVSAEEVQIVTRAYGLDSLVNGDVDAQAGWVTDEVIAAEEKAMEVNVIVPYDHGVTFYADLYAVRDSLIAKDPELVEKFLRATLRGWAAALQDPEKHSQLSLRYDDSLDGPHEVKNLRASAPLIHTGVNRIGWMRPEPWTEMLQTVAGEHELATRPRLEDLFTLRFLQAVYSRP